MHKRPTREVCASDESFRAVVEHALDAMLIADGEGRCADANPAAGALLGLTTDELIGRSAADSSRRGRDFHDIWAEVLGQGTKTGELIFRRADGRQFPAEFSARANFVPGRHLLVVRDVTERKRLEEHIREAQRLEAVGRLAGGIAHDFNNLLTVILGAAELLTEELPKSGSAWRHAAETHTAATRAASLTSQLLAFSRRQLLRPTRVDLGGLVREMLPTLQPS